MNKAISTQISLGKRSIAHISNRFLSVAVDMSQVLGKDWWAPESKVDWALIGSHEGSYDLEPYDFTRSKLRILARHLSPAYLKIGGAKSDKLFYALKTSANHHEFVLTMDKWDEINEFAKACGFEIIFTLNAGRMNRDKKKNWIPEKVCEFVKYTARRHYPVSVWKLGGEINAFITNGSRWRISGKQYAKDFLAARRLIDSLTPGTKLIGCSSAYWPIIGEPFPVSKSFLKNNKAQLDVFGWHYYPQQSTRCPVRVRKAGPYTMLKPENLDEVEKWAQRVERLKQRYSPGSEVWLTETGHAQCGGMPGISDAFIASLWWLDQLGTLAKRGHRVVVRQTLSGSDYGLIDDVTLEPNPDY